MMIFVKNDYSVKNDDFWTRLIFSTKMFIHARKGWFLGNYIILQELGFLIKIRNLNKL